jgi:hypothetical protein
MYARGKATVDTEYLVVDDDRECEIVKHISEVVPNIGIAVLATAFSVKAVRLCHTSRLVVSADQVYAIGISKLETDEK